MIPVHAAIARFRRDITLGSVLNWLLLGGVFFCTLLGGAVISSPAGNLALIAVLGAVWIALGYQSMKSSRLSADSPALIARGEFDQAEDRIEASLRTFSLFRSSKLMSLHHLAVLRHAQQRWADAAELAQALLRLRLGQLAGISRPSRLILAESLLELGELDGSYRAIAGLYEQKLTLAEALRLMHVQLDYLWRVHAWGSMLAGLQSKIEMAELMNTAHGARAQALLALAAHEAGKPELSDWLRRRVELLVDVSELTAARPVLKALWPDGAGDAAVTAH